MRVYNQIVWLLLSAIFAVTTAQSSSPMPDSSTTVMPSTKQTTSTMKPMQDKPNAPQQTSTTDVAGTTKSTTTATTTTPITTTKAPPTNGNKNDELVIQIKHILTTSKTGNFVGNSEFDHESTLLRIAVNLDPSLVNLKQHAYDKFVNYNSLRLKLEGELANRIAVTENYLLSENISDQCRVFYHNQRKELIQARTEPNALKAYKLKIFSEVCPHKDDSDSDSDEDSDYIFWPFFNTELSFLQK